MASEGPWQLGGGWLAGLTKVHWCSSMHAPVGSDLIVGLGQVILISAHKFIEQHAFGHSILLSLQLVA